jgi:cytochrome b561
MSLKMYRPGPTGLEPNPVQVQTWRSRLRSRRWKPAPLANPEMEPTTSRMAVAFWLGLALLTFLTLVFGYGIGLWRMPA